MERCYNVTVTLEQRWICKCDLCGKAWLPERAVEPGGMVPEQCSSCKKRGWNLHGDEQSRAEGGSGKDIGEESVDGRGEAVSGDDEKETRDVRTANGKRVKNVRVMRGRVSERRRTDVTTKVRRPPSGAQSESGAVGNGAQADTGGEGESRAGRVSVVDRPWKGPAHRKGCGCVKCKK